MRITSFLLSLLLSLLLAIEVSAACVRQTGLSCPSGSATATLTSNCSASDSTNYDLWSFTGIAGDKVTINMTSAAFDTYLALLDPLDIAVHADHRRPDRHHHAGRHRAAPLGGEVAGLLPTLM